MNTMKLAERFDYDRYHDRLTIVRTPYEQRRDDFAEAVVEGLTAPQKSLPCRFIYDDRGSALFERICELPEYYPTRCEREILRRHAREIVGSVDDPLNIVELGCGSCSKTRLLIEAAIRAGRPVRYVPVDISPGILETAAERLTREFPELEVVGLACEYMEALAALQREDWGPMLVLFLGSNIGNFERPEATAFVAEIRQFLGAEDRLLLGADLRKARSIVEPAYNDAQGVTQEFTRNLLTRIERELGGDFDPNRFRHVARYLPDEGVVRSELVSQQPQVARIAKLGLEVRFERNEPIHVENSFKFSTMEIEALADASRFSLDRQFRDALGYFSSNLLRPTRSP